MRGDLQEQVVGSAFGVFDEHVEVTIIVEYAGVQELELGLIQRRAVRLSSTSRE